ncbi:MAG: glycosyltransferase family 2 protein [Anaerolineae bacterium]|nr:glycosyltransferase family 2 protein [Anaerolineae bacterium]
MFCSTIIPTVARATLRRTVTSVLTQDFEDALFEVIVVNDSGAPLPPADWQNDDCVRVIHTQRRERSVARNAGAAIARGDYLHFLDDDDWLLPGALANLWQLAQAAPDAVWLYGGTQLIDRAGTPLIELHHGLVGNIFAPVMAGEWIPLQSSLIRSQTFFAVGGFPALMATAEDVQLSRLVARVGDFAETGALIACYVAGEEGSTSDYAGQSPIRREAREDVLDQMGVFQRLRASVSQRTEHRGYWYGRVVRIYLTSLLWNLARRRLLAGGSRGLHGLACFVLALRWGLSPAFWQALLRQYRNRTFERGFAQARLAGPESR